MSRSDHRVRWSDVELGEMITLHRGYDLPAGQRRHGIIPVVSSAGITGYHDEPKVQPPGVVTGRYGTLGEVFFVDRPFWPLNTTLFVSDFHGNDARFIAYFLQCQGLGSRDSASAVPGINRNVLHRLPARRPPISTQRKIAAILSAYDELIENNDRRIRLLEEMAQRIYREWFVDFRYPGHENIPRAESELGPVPEGWRLCSLSELVGTQYGYTESATADPVGPHFLRGMDINKTSYVDWATVPYCPIDASSYSKYRLSRGDVVVIRMADPGKVGIVETDVNAVFASYLIRVRPLGELVVPYFLFYFMSSDRYQAFVTGASTGTTRKSLSAPLITSISLAVPPPRLQNAFVDSVAPLRYLMTQLTCASANLRAGRDLLLPRLISGQIDVTELDIAMPQESA